MVSVMSSPANDGCTCAERRSQAMAIQPAEEKVALADEPMSNSQCPKWCIEDFVLERVIGRGRFGKVFLAQERKNKFNVAIKMIKKTSIQEDMKDQVFHELAVHSLFKHPHIIFQYTFFHNEENICTVMEYASFNSLYVVMRTQKFKRFREADAAKYVGQVASALCHMHARLYIHRDVKPENVLIDEKGNAKLGDFGWVTSLVGRPRGYCGTTGYMAPEVIQGRVYNHSVDIWCLGVMAYELLVGRSPFYSIKPKKTVGKILERNINFPNIVRSVAKEFVLKLVVVNPKKRLALSKALTHRWVAAYYKSPALSYF